MLSKSEINKFKNDGFVLIRELFSKNEVKTLIKYTEELQNSPEISGREWKFFEESKKSDSFTPNPTQKDKSFFDRVKEMFG